MALRFLHQKCSQDLIARLVVAIKEMQALYLKEVVSHMGTGTPHEDIPKAQDDLTAEQVNVLAAYITAQVTGGVWATMLEWGTGSQMDGSNPALAAYHQSNKWNPMRMDSTIRTRPATVGEYSEQYDIFGNRIVKTTGRGGFNLEKSGDVIPMPAKHAMRDAMRWMQVKGVRDILRNAIATFPFHMYIVVTKK